MEDKAFEIFLVFLGAVIGIFLAIPKKKAEILVSVEQEKTKIFYDMVNQFYRDCLNCVVWSELSIENYSKLRKLNSVAVKQRELLINFRSDNIRILRKSKLYKSANRLIELSDAYRNNYVLYIIGEFIATKHSEPDKGKRKENISRLLNDEIFPKLTKAYLDFVD